MAFDFFLVNSELCDSLIMCLLSCQNHICVLCGMASYIGSSSRGLNLYTILFCNHICVICGMYSFVASNAMGLYFLVFYVKLCGSIMIMFVLLCGNDIRVLCGMASF